MESLRPENQSEERELRDLFLSDLDYFISLEEQGAVDHTGERGNDKAHLEEIKEAVLSGFYPAQDDYEMIHDLRIGQLNGNFKQYTAQVLREGDLGRDLTPRQLLWSFVAKRHRLQSGELKDRLKKVREQLH